MPVRHHRNTHDEDPNDASSAKWLEILNRTAQAVAAVALVIAVGVIMWRFASL
jgi:hypothetical protein